jgi:hypothetical protein
MSSGQESTLSNLQLEMVSDKGLLVLQFYNELFVLFRKAGFGCQLSGLFMGCFGYSDDLFLLSASRSGLQAMVNIFQEFTSSKNLKFTTNVDPDKSKTKCLIFSKHVRDRENILPILLDGVPLPWVSQVKHFGNML